jgi:hypothetical protein
MSPSASLVFVFGLLSTDPREFYTAANGITDASFTFEGEFGKLDKDGWIPNTATSFVGQGGFHRDGVVFLEWQGASPTGSVLNRVSVRESGIVRKEVTLPGLPPRQTESKGSFASLASNTETFAMVWPTCIFYAISSQTRPEWNDEGDQPIDGVPCRVFAWKAGTSTWRFWLDPAKEGNAVRFEKWSNGKLRLRTSGYSFAQIFGKDGKKHLVPVSARTESFWDTNAPKGSQFVDKPVTRADYRIVPTTVIVNSGRNADSFEIKRSQTVRVVDLDNKNTTPPTDTPKPGKSTHVRVLNDPAEAAVKERELLEGLNESKTSIDWNAALSWGLAGAGLAAVCIGITLYLRK